MFFSCCIFNAKNFFLLFFFRKHVKNIFENLRPLRNNIFIVQNIKLKGGLIFSFSISILQPLFFAYLTQIISDDLVLLYLAAAPRLIDSALLKSSLRVEPIFSRGKILHFRTLMISIGDSTNGRMRYRCTGKVGEYEISLIFWYFIL